MKDFFKFLIASTLGVFLAGLLLLGAGFALIVILLSIPSATEGVKEHTVLTIGLGADLPDYSSDESFPEFDVQNFTFVQPVGLADILSAIHSAKNDGRIAGIFLTPTIVPSGIATVTAVREALLDFKTSGKFVYAYSETYTQKAYYLASAADSIWLNPAGSFLLPGMRSEVIYYKGALDKLGVEVQVFRHGKFKSAVEPFTEEGMSAESRTQTKLLIDRIWSRILGGIAKARNLNVDQLNLWIDELSVNGAEASVKKGLVDGLLYADQVRDRLAVRSGIESADDLSFLAIDKYALREKESTDASDASARIAVVYAEGDIDSDMSFGGSAIQPKVFVALLRQLRKDSAVKAIVLRVNSPGGSALGSDLIWREVFLTSQVKPVVASFGNVAASGGYYIASPARYVFAETTSITGSIGVFALLPQVKELMNQKLGIRVDVVGSNKHSDSETVFRPLDAEERAVLQQEVEVTYQAFLSHVAEGRHLSVAQVDEIGQGRVWAAEDALRVGLIDSLGGLNDAVIKAASLAGIKSFGVDSYPKRSTTVSDFLFGMRESLRSHALANEIKTYVPFYQDILYLSGKQGIQARLPFQLNLY